MPELPEVETVVCGLRPLIVGRRVEKTHIYNASLRWPIPVEAVKRLENNRIATLSRRSKYIIMELEATDKPRECETSFLLMHLGMSGSMRVLPKQAPLLKHDHFVMQLGDGASLRFNDPRRFGAVLYTKNWQQHELIIRLGPEPLSADFIAEQFANVVRTKMRPIKSVVMDNHVVVGVGNIYANEALFRAGIHPKRFGAKISVPRLLTLAATIKEVLADAVAAGGTTLKDFSDAEGRPGYFQQKLFVYGRAGEPCLQCDGEIKQMRLGQRSTFYCSNCQR